MNKKEYAKSINAALNLARASGESELDAIEYALKQFEHSIRGRINTLIDEDLLHRAIDLWGRDVQINKIQEEALELSLVLNQRNCPTKDPGQMDEQLYDELADMKIMMAYAEILFNGNRINERVAFKLHKLETKYLS